MSLAQYTRAKEKTGALLAVTALAILFSFWKLGTQPLCEWDECRYGVIAGQMNERGEYFTYYFLNNPDGNMFKPHLPMWSIAASLQVFGDNEFGLRFPSALCAVIIFITFFLWCALYWRPWKALLATLILLGVKAICGYHVGRTGDTDAMLVCFMMLSVYFFSGYIDFGKKNGLWLCALFTALAVLTKSVVGLFLVSSFIMYALLLGRGKEIAPRRLVLPLLIFILPVLVWAASVWVRNPGFIARMWEVDIYSRFFKGTDADNMQFVHKWLFVPVTLDVSFNLWNYVLYLAVVVAAYQFIRVRKGGVRFNTPAITALSVLLILPTALLLTISRGQLTWYLAPVIPFCASFVVGVLTRLNHRVVNVTLFGLVAFTVVRHFIYLNDEPESRGKLIKQQEQLIRNAKQAYWYNAGNEQDFFLYLTWYRGDIAWADNKNMPERVNFTQGDVLLGRKDDFLNDYVAAHPDLKLREAEGYFILSAN